MSSTVHVVAHLRVLSGRGSPAASAAFTSRAWRHWPRYSKPGQLHVTSAPSAVMT